MNVIEFIRNKHDAFFKAFLFVIALGLIAWIFPRQGKFKYVFKQGKPWAHKALYAPFDFAIYKTKKELADEKEQIKANAKAYFNIDTTAEAKAIITFNSLFLKQWNDSLAQKVATQGGFFNNLWGASATEINKIKKASHDLGITLIKDVYGKGVIQLNLINTKYVGDTSNFMLLENNVAELHSFHDFYTLPSAINFVKANITKQKDITENFLLTVIESVIQRNIIYNAAVTKKVYASDLNKVSLTQGKIQDGERIISTGDLVDAQKFQILNSFKKEYLNRIGNNNSNAVLLIGQCLLIGLILFILFLFIRLFRTDILNDNLKISFLLLMIVLIVLAAEAVLHVSKLNIYLIPFCILPLIIRTFYDSRLAQFMHLCAITIVGFIAPNPFEFFILQFIAGTVTIFSVLQLRKRSQFFTSILIIFITYSVSYISLGVIQEGNFNNISWSNLGWFAGSSILTLLAYPLIYLFEKTFGFISEITFMELSDTNNHLLRELNMKAPGTFQHSLQVANLAEEAVLEIGGNALMVRTGALYHDIGKMYRPLYFTENQTTGINPHDDISYEESASIIIQHVIKGIEMARRNKIPDQIIDFIRTHHGTTFTRYFYTMYKNEHPKKAIDESKFRYPGPVPYSKETAVLMMADSVEAASKSLKHYDEETISTFVENIINMQIQEDQFINANITFKDITKIKKIFKNKLMSIYHVRIAYPKGS